MANDTELDAILKRMATEHRPELPSAGLIWFRAQMARKKLEKERIERPLLAMSVLACVTGAIVMVIFIGGNWGQVRDVLDHGSWFLLAALLLALVATAASGAILLKLPNPPLETKGGAPTKW